jgi:hypothetical protein
MQIALPPMVAVDLGAIVVRDGADEFLQQLDQFGGALVGEARQRKGQEDGFAFR